MKMSRRHTLPTKTTLNLVINEIPPHYYRNLLIATVIVAAAILAFAKFGVIDRLARVNDEWRKTDEIRLQLSSVSQINERFDEVREEYNLYFANNASQGEVVDVTEVLRIVEQRLRPAADVTSVSLMNNTLSVLLGGITLEQATGILTELYDKEPLVESVELYTAVNAEGERTMISMTIGFNPQGGEADA